MEVGARAVPVDGVLGDPDPASANIPTLVIRRSADETALPSGRPARRLSPARDGSGEESSPPLSLAQLQAKVVTPDTPPPPPSAALREALVKLREVFKIRALRPGQAEIIESVLAGRDTLAIMPTGSGKSLTYQLPSLVLPGPTLVVSPLLALIEDQVKKLQAAGVPVARIDSTRTAKERAADLEAVREGKIKLVIITPESIGSPAVQAALEGVKFSLFAVDEAHCVSQWGHDFRPAYLGLRRAANVLGRPPILALTATATPSIADDVLVQLGMRDANVFRVSFHRPNLAFDVRKVAGEGDKLRQLGKLIQRLRRPGIVYCATVRAVDDLYVALRHGKIPVERYNGKMTGEEREKAQASFMQSGRKVVMLATNAFGLGIDKPDIRYIIHYQMPGSPESYVQEAGRAGRDGKPARCVLLFQPEDIEIQEHFLREAHPTKAQARMVADGLYAWSDEGKEVSVRDLALSMALPERRVRVILSVLEAMGVAEEVKAARWKGVDPKPARERIDKAASVFEARRISDRRRLAALLAYMNTQRCRTQMLRAYFGEPEGAACGLCDSCAGVDSEIFDPGSADSRHGLHAATDFHARPRRRRRRGGVAEPRVPQRMPARDVPPPREVPAPISAPAFATAIPGELVPFLPAFEIPPPPPSEATVDPEVWAPTASGDSAPGMVMAGEPVMDDYAAWVDQAFAKPLSVAPIFPPTIAATTTAATTIATTTATTIATTIAPSEMTAEAAAVEPDALSGSAAPAPRDETSDPFLSGWTAVRDANIRPYAEWRAAEFVSLPVMPRAQPPASGGPRPAQNQAGQSGGNGNNGNKGSSGGSSNGGGPRGFRPSQPQNARPANGGPPAPDGRRRRRGGANPKRPDRNDRGDRGGRFRDRDRGPRLPGFYNPGGD
jgi:ATP-dependent DNA helicase RecQ